MSSTIQILPDTLINKIAAGEVVERPASVVKELVENALDAGATDIAVDAEQAGRRLIRISDNGGGMSREDARIAFERHATSKISSEQDLEQITTMGFRGEALSSIASVAQVRLLTAQQGAAAGTLIEIDGGVVKTVAEAAAAPGTIIEVNHLFYNTPARLKFLKSPSTELSHIIDAVSHQAMAHPAVRFRLTHDTKSLLDLPSTASLHDRAFQVFGRELSDNLREFYGTREPVRVFGLIGQPNYSRADKSYQEFYVNKRYVRNPALSHALYQAYSDLLMRDRHPAGFIFLELAPSLVDVNVHPAKAEVRFRNQSQIHDLVREVIREALCRSPAAPELSPDRTASSGGGVREAVADYLVSSTGPDCRAKAQSPHFFGRRKSDLTANLPLPHDAAPSETVEPMAAFPSFEKEVLIPVAQVHNSYIVAQFADGMALIDQHAAHERVLFERLQNQHRLGTVAVQDLLLPIQVELSSSERERLQDHLQELRDMGFVIEAFGGGTFLIKAVPALVVGGDYKQLFFDILDEIKVHGKNGKIESLRNDILSVLACHPAIKVHRRLSLREMEDLIRNLFSCRMPHSCPHGRPTVVRFSIDEIRKMFKRI